MNRTFQACPNCGSGTIAPVPGFEPKNLMRCAACRFVFDARIPGPEELDAFYGTYSYSARRPCPPATVDSYNRLLDRFEAYRKSGRILDVGCGQGDFLLQARRRGWSAFGTEYSQAAVALCRAEGLDVVQGALTSDTFPDGGFDVVTSFEVFEHINDGASEIARIAQRLGAGGLFYLTKPNFDALLRHLEGIDFKMVAWPEHISFYTPASLKTLAMSAGFDVQQVETTGLAPGRLKAVFRRPRPADHRGSSPQTQSWRSETDDLRDRIRWSHTLQTIK